MALFSRYCQRTAKGNEMRREHILVGCYVQDTKRNKLYEVISRDPPNKVIMVDAKTDYGDPSVEPVEWLIGVAESRLQLVHPAPDWGSVASEAEWGKAG